MNQTIFVNGVGAFMEYKENIDPYFVFFLTWLIIKKNPILFLLCGLIIFKVHSDTSN